MSLEVPRLLRRARRGGPDAPPVGRPAPVSPALYSAALLEAFAGGEHAAFLARGGRPLRARLARALALADLRPGLDLVDIGCGRGEAAVHAARRGARVTAIDFSPGSLALTRRTAGLLARSRRGRPCAPPRLLRAEAAALPLPDGSADRVLLLDLVEHLHPWQLAGLLAEAKRILRPGGYVIIHTLPNRWALALAYPLFRCLAPALPADARSSYERAVHVNEQSPRSLARALAEAGFSARVWVEEWSTRQAARARRHRYPDPLREAGYPVLARPAVGRWSGRLMRTPLRWCLGNDLFALAWRPGEPGPPAVGRFRPLHQAPPSRLTAAGLFGYINLR